MKRKRYTSHGTGIGYRTAMGAKKRVMMKRGLRAKKIKIPKKISTGKLKRLVASV